MGMDVKSLEETGFIYQYTNSTAIDMLITEQKASVYLGIDPTHPSLHVGHLLPIMLLIRLMKSGLQGIIVSGGGTAMIGDPTGKTAMRPILAADILQKNSASHTACLTTIFKRAGVLDRVIFVDNAQWLQQLSLIDYLRTVGQHFSVNVMTKLESNKARIESEQGLSLLEFMYSTLQAYDFHQLYTQYNCQLQIGGTDQWGNIIAGVDLIHKIHRCDVHALTVPLLTTADGKKMGKTEGGAVFLDAHYCSPYDFYHYFRNVHDADVVRFLQLFTDISSDAIAHYKTYTGEALNELKVLLAYTVCTFIHGEEAAKSAQSAAHAAFANSGDITNMPSIDMQQSDFHEGINVVDFFTRTPLCVSKSEARRLILQGGAYINGEIVTHIDMVVDMKYIENNAILLRAGKKRYYRINVI